MEKYEFEGLIEIRVGKNHDFFEKINKSDFFDLIMIFLIFLIYLIFFPILLKKNAKIRHFAHNLVSL